MSGYEGAESNCDNVAGNISLMEENKKYLNNFFWNNLMPIQHLGELRNGSNDTHSRAVRV